MTRQEAKELTIKNRECSEELNKIFEAIKEECNKGKSMLIYWMYNKNKARFISQKLEALDYEVGYEEQPDPDAGPGSGDGLDIKLSIEWY